MEPGGQALLRHLFLGLIQALRAHFVAPTGALSWV